MDGNAALSEEEIERRLREAKSPDVNARFDALTTLFRTDRPRFAPLYVEALADASPKIRGRALLALAGANAPDTWRHVVPLLDDPDVHIRAFAAFALGRMRATGAVDALISRLPSAPEEAMALFCWALREIGDKRAVPALCHIAETHRSMLGRLYGALAVSRLDEALGADLLRAVLQHADELPPEERRPSRRRLAELEKRLRGGRETAGTDDEDE